MVDSPNLNWCLPDFWIINSITQSQLGLPHWQDQHLGYVSGSHSLGVTKPKCTTTTGRVEKRCTERISCSLGRQNEDRLILKVSDTKPENRCFLTCCFLIQTMINRSAHFMNENNEHILDKDISGMPRAAFPTSAPMFIQAAFLQPGIPFQVSKQNQFQLATWHDWLNVWGHPWKWRCY